VLARALADAGIARQSVYTSNAGEVQACLPWVAAEMPAGKPELVVCLGATAAPAPLGRDYRVTQEHGTFREGAECQRTYLSYSAHRMKIERRSAAGRRSVL
jgi:uracil-DNA glycosylase